jgi:hypothetical protein
VGGVRSSSREFGTYEIRMAVRGAENIPFHLEMAVRIRLTTSTAGELWIYSLSIPVITAGGQSTWGGIKALYRE